MKTHLLLMGAISLAPVAFAVDYTVFRVCEDQHIIRTSDGQEAGRVEYIVIDPSNQRVVSTIVSGGVMGERFVAVPYHAMRFGTGREITLTEITRERLISAPVIERQTLTTRRVEPDFFERTSQHFGMRFETSVGGDNPRAGAPGTDHPRRPGEPISSDVPRGPRRPDGSSNAASDPNRPAGQTGQPGNLPNPQRSSQNPPTGQPGQPGQNGQSNPPGVNDPNSGQKPGSNTRPPADANSKRPGADAEENSKPKAKRDEAPSARTPERGPTDPSGDKAKRPTPGEQPTKNDRPANPDRPGTKGDRDDQSARTPRKAPDHEEPRGKGEDRGDKPNREKSDRNDDKPRPNGDKPKPNDEGNRKAQTKPGRKPEHDAEKPGDKHEGPTGKPRENKDRSPQPPESEKRNSQEKKDRQ